MKRRLFSLILVFSMVLSMVQLQEVSALSVTELQSQITSTYKAALEKSNRTSFNGYCATLVNWELVVLGINTSYVRGNGKDEFDNYKNLSSSSGGYRIHAYPAGTYSVLSALNAISKNGTKDVFNILVGFEQSTMSSNGRIYGHTCFINGIIDGQVYYCESYNANIAGKKHPEGTVICCSIAEFASYYDARTTFDGIIYFENPYLSRCTPYPSSGTVKITKKTTLKSLPCSKDTNKDSTDIGNPSIGSSLVVTGIYKNTFGNYWYETECDGTTCYLYSGDAVFLEHDYGKATISDVSVPTSIVESNSFSIEGLVTSDKLPLRQVGAYVYQGPDLNVTIYLKCEDTEITGKAYQLYNNKVEKGLKFESLSPGTYTFLLAAVVHSYEADNNELSPPSAKAIELHKSFLVVTEKPAEHTCNKGTYAFYEAAHPHCNAYKCSICGAIWADYASSNVIVSCEQCRPGKAILNVQPISSNDTGETLTFSWEETDNTTHYNLWLDKKNSDGIWESVEQVFYAESGFVRSLAPGEYRAQLLSYSSNFWEEDGSDWIHTWADDVFFSIEEARCSHDYISTLTQSPTCVRNGIITHVCALCSDTYTETVPPTGHSYICETIDATCMDYEKIRYTCTNCSETYEEYVSDPYSAWSETKPEGVDAALLETKTQYRYSDYETRLSYSPTMDGYTQVGSVWEQNGSGTTEYVKSWPSGFSTNHSLYRTYGYLPYTEIETEFEKVEIDSESVSGYIYYHWCRGTYANGPTNRKTSREYTSECNAFHAFYSTISPSGMATSADGSINNANKSCCRDTYWYYDIPVYTQNYTYYCKLFTFARWSDWSQWSDTAYVASDNRQVESRTVYRYANTALADHNYADGYCTVCGVSSVMEHLTYTITDGKVTITDCDTAASGELVIPATIEGYPVTGIGALAFDGCKGLTSITIPDGVTGIGSDAFRDCTGLTCVSIPDGVTSIGESAFRDCFGLTGITIGNGVTGIGSYAFYGCKGLTDITIPDSVTIVGWDAFGDCIGLTRVTIGNGVTSIGEQTFYGCTGLTSINIPDSVTDIKDNAFNGCNSLTDVYYSGTADQWDEISIDFGNKVLANATIHYKTDLLGIAGVNLALNNDITLYLYLMAEDYDPTYTMEIVKTYADGREVIKTVPAADWENYYGVMYRVGFNGIAAKEMTDDIIVTVKDSGGNVVSERFVITVAEAAMWLYDSTTNEQLYTLIADLLNYGAAAQTQFNYNTGKLANAVMSDTQKGYASAPFDMSTIQGEPTLSDAAIGSSLTLETNIQQNFYFDGAVVDTTMTAHVSYTDYKGNVKTATVHGSDFAENSGMVVVTVDTLVPADVNVIVTVEIVKADGTVAATIADSMASYCKYMYDGTTGIYRELMEFTTSCYEYFGG